jgi:HSP20 family protein
MEVKNFFSRITGSAEEYDDFFDDPKAERVPLKGDTTERHARLPVKTSPQGEKGEEGVGELAVDVYQTPDAIVVKALIAGVQPGAVDISLTREMVTISGTRHDEREVEEDNYYQRELYWGSFSRTVLLPEEVDVDLAEATEKHGILVIRLPKVDKKKQAKLKVRSR